MSGGLCLRPEAEEADSCDGRGLREHQSRAAQVCTERSGAAPRGGRIAGLGVKRPRLWSQPCQPLLGDPEQVPTALWPSVSSPGRLKFHLDNPQSPFQL